MPRKQFYQGRALFEDTWVDWIGSCLRRVERTDEVSRFYFIYLVVDIIAAVEEFGALRFEHDM